MVVTCFFLFADLNDEVEVLQSELLNLPGLKGMVLLAKEGINGTVCGEANAIERLRTVLANQPKLAGLEYKDSSAPTNPFPKWKVEIKDQVILYKEGIHPQGRHNHLSPSEWHELLTGDEPVTVLDTRNYYETRVGVFKDAVDPQIEKFTDFSDYLEQCDLPKDRKTLIYCTGGIRCEKAIFDMEEQGFRDVHQLDGGILKYLEEYPDETFQGECFVFDNRVAVDQQLAPSEKFWICPHCGDPGDLRMPCAQCHKEALLCSDCAEQLPTCSKDCTYHWKRLGSKR